MVCFLDSWCMYDTPFLVASFTHHTVFSRRPHRVVATSTAPKCSGNVANFIYPPSSIKPVFALVLQPGTPLHYCTVDATDSRFRQTDTILPAMPAWGTSTNTCLNERNCYTTTHQFIYSRDLFALHRSRFAKPFECAITASTRGVILDHGNIIERNADTLF